MEDQYKVLIQMIEGGGGREEGGAGHYAPSLFIFHKSAVMKE